MTATVTVEGDEQLSVQSDEAAERFSTERRTFAYHCSTEGPIEGEWIGVPIGELIEAAAIPERATHLLVEGEDGYRAPVPVLTAFEGLLALKRVDGPDDTPRFLASGADSAQAVRDVIRIGWLAVPPGEDPDEYASD